MPEIELPLQQEPKPELSLQREPKPVKPPEPEPSAERVVLPEPDPELRLLPKPLLELLQEHRLEPKLLLKRKENVPDRLQPAKPELPPEQLPEPEP